MIVRVTKTFRFEMAHALEGHDGPCSRIHGHSYRLSVTLKGNTVTDPQDPKNGMVMDFSDLKQLVHQAVIVPFDHALVLRRDSAPALLDALARQKLLLTDFQPTCENLVAHFARKLRDLLPATVQLHHLLLHETSTAYAEWYAEDNQTDT